MNDRKEGKKKRPAKKSWIMAFFVIAVLIPGTLYISFRFSNRQFYLTSLLLLAYIMVPFFMRFERRSHKARDLTALAVMCAIAAVSRILFIWVPHFKPMTAVILITGAAFGPEAGFLAGAVSGFVSQFFFGQGPWTPWQMFAFGTAGFLIGILCQKGIVKKKRIPLGLCGGLLTLFVVGPVLDTCSLFLMASQIRWESAAAIYLAGLPVNLVHAAATALTLFAISEPMLEKLERVKTKYGVMEG